jgi:hypothetical protein
MENDNNFGYEKITILVDNMPLSWTVVIKLGLSVNFLNYYVSNTQVALMTGCNWVPWAFGECKSPCK